MIRQSDGRIKTNAPRPNLVVLSAHGEIGLSCRMRPTEMFTSFHLAIAQRKTLRFDGSFDQERTQTRGGSGKYSGATSGSNF